MTTLPNFIHQDTLKSEDHFASPFTKGGTFRIPGLYVPMPIGSNCVNERTNLMIIGNFSVLQFLFACLTTWATAALAQQTDSTIYLRLDYMKVRPEKAAEYVEMEQQIWKPIHQELKKAGNLLNWNLYTVQFPGGTENGYNFVTVNVYDELADVENPYPEDIFSRVHAGTDISELASKTYAARDLVRSELWVLIDQAQTAGDTSKPSRYAQVDYMRLKPGGDAEYTSLEQDVFKPIHQARISEGKINSWGLYALMLPGGTDYEYNYGTANFFDSLADLENSYPTELISRVHAGADISEMIRKTNAARDLVRSELWELIDYAE